MIPVGAASLRTPGVFIAVCRISPAAMQSKNQLFQFGIRQKVVLILVTVLLSAFTVSGWLALEQEKRDALQEFHQRGSDITQFVAKSLAYSVVGYDYHTIQLLLDEITSSDIVAYARVTGARGNLMAEAGSRQLGGGKNVLILTKNIVLDGDVVGYLTTGISMKGTLTRLASQKYNLVEREALIILMIAICEFLALSYLIIRPVRLMTESLGQGLNRTSDTVGLLPVISNDEFGDLARQFNTLSVQLNDANSRLRGKIISADRQLQSTNNMLLQQSRELRKLNEEFKLLSITDSLTGLYNRRYYESMIEAEISISARHGIPNSILLIDVDHFKKINDVHGHHTGDLVLEEIARRMRSKIRLSDVLCRFGGEEFIVFCKNTDQGDAINIAEKLRLAVLERKFIIGHETLNVSISIGVATLPDFHSTDTATDFYRHADIALYQSKGEGRNRVTHYANCVHTGSLTV
jgi:diguanylate cyclase (GGDEF)-like protein